MTARAVAAVTMEPPSHFAESDDSPLSASAFLSFTPNNVVPVSLLPTLAGCTSMDSRIRLPPSPPWATPSMPHGCQRGNSQFWHYAGSQSLSR
jgi:hypothetical protein